jgi:hypothetical protein
MTLRKPLLRDRALRVADLPDGQNLFNFPDDRFGQWAFSLPNRPRVNRNFLKRFNPVWVVGSPRPNISLSDNQKLWFLSAIPPHRRGAYASSRTWRRDAVDAIAAVDD